MAAAAATWQRAGYVRSVYRPAYDGSCDASNGNVVFDVRPTSGQQYLARAFFPSYQRSSRSILIDSSAFGNIGHYTLAGILRHELGHTLGFRHEHTRPEAGTCFEDSSYRVLTTYDSDSVMHYPQCNGTNQGDLMLTLKDVVGTTSLYGAVAAIYEGAYYQGIGQALPPGQYDMGQLSLGNDTLSSLAVPSGWMVTLFQNAGFSGASKTFTANADYVGNDWNDITSSITVADTTISSVLRSGLGSQICLDMAGGVAANGTNVQIYACNGSLAQRWEMQPDGSIQSALNPSYCLDVQYSGAADGTNVQVYQCNGTDAQKWTLTASGELRSALGQNICLDVQYSGTANGTNVQIYQCNGTNAQKWFKSGS